MQSLSYQSSQKRELKKKEKEIKGVFQHAVINNYSSIDIISDLSKQHEIAKKNLEKIQAQLKSTDTELTALKKVDHSVTYNVHVLVNALILG